MGSQRVHMTEQLNKGNMLAKIGTIKDRNGMDLTEAAEIKKMWQEDTEELYKTQGGMITPRARHPGV